jgi:hypothetical protein
VVVSLPGAVVPVPIKLGVPDAIEEVPLAFDVVDPVGEAPLLLDVEDFPEAVVAPLGELPGVWVACTRYVSEYFSFSRMRFKNCMRKNIHRVKQRSCVPEVQATLQRR